MAAIPAPFDADVRSRWDADFRPVVPEFTPWCHLNVDLRAARVALVTTAGLYLGNGFQAPFAVEPPAGDPSFRELPANVDLTDLALAHPDREDLTLAAGDWNAVFPLDALRHLARGGVVGEVAPLHYSLMGYSSQPLGLLIEAVPAITQRLRQASVGLVLVVAVASLGHQTAGLAARALEAAGLPTLVIGTLPAWLERVQPPRAVWLDHPPAAPVGPPGNGAKHQEVLKAALTAATQMPGPGSLWSLPFRWQPR